MIIIKEQDNLTLTKHSQLNTLKSCQCIKDCDCNSNFSPTLVEKYRVVRILSNGKRKTSWHHSLEDAEKRWNFLTNL